MILNRRRFLSKYGFDTTSGATGGVPNNNQPMLYGTLNNGGMEYQQQQQPIKAQIIGLLQAVQYLKVPVILCNIVTIVFEILLGGT
jgi:Yos1-like